MATKSSQNPEPTRGKDTRQTLAVIHLLIHLYQAMIHKLGSPARSRDDSLPSASRFDHSGWTQEHHRVHPFQPTYISRRRAEAFGGRSLSESSQNRSDMGCTAGRFGLVSHPSVLRLNCRGRLLYTTPFQWDIISSTDYVPVEIWTTILDLVIHIQR